MDILLLFSLIAFGLGCLFAHNFIPNRYELDVFLPNLIITGIGLFFMLFVPLRIFYYCMKKPSKQSRNLDYSIERKHLFTDYDRLNPVTK